LNPEAMNLDQVKREVSAISKIPAAEKMYPITSDWVPITDVLAIIQRFEKYWKNAQPSKPEAESKVISEILGGT
jgi:hypothetical protein